MKIAFASCMSTQSYPGSQPVWSHIAQQNPDVLVLLGDSVYLDIGAPSDGVDANGAPNNHPSKWGSNFFAKQLLALYAAQMQIPQFKQLIERPSLTTYAIWDDHDFLWNDADSRVASQPAHTEKLVLSANLLGCWRDALKGTPLPISSEGSVSARIWQNSTAATHANYGAYMPGYQPHVLAEGKIVLHLTDGRSWRARATVLGAAQRAQLLAILVKYPTAVHVIASGSSVQEGGSSWKHYPDDYSWLKNLAAQYNILVISGDVHKNMLHEPLPTHDQSPTTTKKLFEATSSGAAVSFAPWHKKDSPHMGFATFSEKFGLLDIDSYGNVDVSLFEQNQVDVDVQGRPMTRRIPASFV